MVELKSEHKRICDTLLDIGEALERCDLMTCMKLLGSINAPVGAHMKFEDDILYPMLKRSFGETIDSLINEHTEVRVSSRHLAEILCNDDLSEMEKVVAGWWEIMPLLDHLMNCDEVLDKMKKLSKEENYWLGLKLQEARSLKIPMIAWAKELDDHHLQDSNPDRVNLLSKSI